MTVAWLVGCLLVAGAAFWAGLVVARPAATPLDTPTVALYTVQQGTVGKNYAVPVTATWPAGVPVVAAGAGTVTSLEIADGDDVAAGDVIATVDLQPLIAGEGAVPAFRDLAAGDAGADVSQLQRLLALSEPTVAVTGTMDDATVTAVKRWQTRVGLPPDGIVHRGQVVFVATLPTRVSLADGLMVGSQVSAGQVLATAATGTPVFTIAVTPDQTQLIPQDGEVTVTAADQTWTGQVVSSRIDRSTGGAIWTVEAADGGPLCGADCALLDLPGPDQLDGSIVAVPPTSGPVAPMASVVSDPSGATAVVMADGTVRPVTVMASGSGLAVLDGVKAGEQIQLFDASGQ